MNKKKLSNYGDIFFLQLKNKEKYVIGRVLFDVENQFHKTVSATENYFNVFRECQLVEIYESIYDSPVKVDSTKIILPNTFVYRIDSKENKIK
ncbi:hypothetical protein MKJ01_18375 [Chryseobacterium sp. SSA4.19]|uniref:hypothetical protein n=1 Tax=Chryseobacterium sp. SSA4.19 TaxID=2919915 RepID=UPI001F4FAD0F|nr:hypothetical protein [Chryseobacterium sp. SSA4.19]MCJ8155725.1 hypothetical protein [Chryseobacterium sp. SSA4.19]